MPARALAALLLFASRAAFADAQPPLQAPPADVSHPDGNQAGLGTSSVARFTGELAHHIPIQVPPYHGLEPALALHYHSGQRDGFVGVGWTLKGVNVIQRASPGRGAPNYGGGDIFLLDGMELVPCAAGSVSPSCANGGTHATKIESYHRVAYDGTSWRVTRKDGTVEQYDPVYTTVGGTFRWGLSSVSDRNGNVVNYHWWCEAGLECYPASITYNRTTVTFNREQRALDNLTFANGSPTLGQSNWLLKSIDITTDGARARAYRLWWAASGSNPQSVLQAVQMYGKDATVDANGNVNGPSSLPLTTFTYNSGPSNPLAGPMLWGWPTAGTGLGGNCYNGWCSNIGDQAVTGDFNGDGKTDVLMRDAYYSDSNQGNAAVFWASGNSAAPFTTTLAWNNAVSGTGLGQTCYQGWCAHGDDIVVPADFDGDGKTDLYVASYSSTWRMVLFATGDPNNPFSGTMLWSPNSGNGLAQSCYDGWCAGVNDQIIPGDFNGDGKTDFLVQNDVRNNSGNTPNNKWIFWGTGNRSAPFTATVAWSGSNTASGPGTYCYNGWCSGTGDRFQIADFNGDGKIDLYVQNSSNTYRAALFGTGNPNDPFTATFLWTPAPGNGVGQSCYNNWCRAFGMMVGDYNGDGKADLFLSDYSGNTDIFWSTGDAAQPFVAQALWSSATAGTGLGQQCYSGWCGGGNGYFGSGDFNGDGITDFWLRDNPASNGAARVYFFTGTGNPVIPFRAAQYWNPDSSGTGIGQSCYGGWCARSWDNVAPGDYNGDGKTDLLFQAADRGWTGLFFAQGPMENLITHIDNGIGGTLDVAYQPSSSWQNTNLPFVVPTVWQSTTGDGRSGAATTVYNYSGGLWDALDRRFLGFHYVKATLPCNYYESSCPYEETWFAQDYGSVSKPQIINRSNGAGVLLTSLVYEYATNGTHVPYQSMQTGLWRYAYDGSGSVCNSWPCPYGKRVYTQTRYDNYDPWNPLWKVGYSEPWAIIEYGDYDVGGDERVAAFGYVPNGSLYIVDKPAVMEMHAGLTAAGTMLEQSLLLYDYAGTWNAQPSYGNLTTVQRWLDTGPTPVTHSFTYDASGNVVKIVDERNNPTTIQYDLAYNVYPHIETNAAGKSTTHIWDPLCAVETKATDANQQDTSMVPDALCRPSQITAPLGGVVNYSYCGTAGNPCGDANAQYVHTDTPSADGNGPQWTQQFFDGLGRIWRAVRKGPDAQHSIYSDTVYQTRAGVQQQSRPYYATDTPTWSYYTYDALDRWTKTQFADNTTTYMAYGTGACASPAPGATCFATTHTDELGHNQIDLSDAYGNVVLHRVFSRGTPVDTQYIYDLRGSLAQITDAAQNQWSYTTDSLKRIITSRDPDLGTWTFQYDPAGNLTTQTDAKGQVTAMAYDPIDRLSAMTSLAATSSQATSTWTYDENRSGYYNVGHLTSVIDPYGGETMNYNAAGKQATYTRTIGSSSYTFTASYDAGGRLIAAGYPDGDTAGTSSAPRTYDGGGRPFGIPGIIDSAQYDASDNLTHFNAHNGTSTNRVYSYARGWLTSVQTTSPAQTLPVVSVDLTRDAKGRITARNSPFCSDGWSYGYDDLDRLTSAMSRSDYSKNTSYSYDNVGNITYNSQLGPYSYNPGTHAVASAGQNVYRYDLNGNMSSRNGQTATWDGLNRLTSIAGSSFSYDAHGARLSKVNGANSTYYLNEDVEVSNGSFNKYFRLGGQRVAQRSGAATYWVHGDHLESLDSVTDTSGRPAGGRMTYWPYGDRMSNDVSTAEGIGFTGERQDETGLLYLHARYYDPQLGRFTSADTASPVASGVGVNRYSYANNDPIGHADHNGHDGEGDDGSDGSDSSPEPQSGGTSADVPVVEGIEMEVTAVAPGNASSSSATPDTTDPLPREREERIL
ncbi:MAG TPA: FG-GAP-like repeat-containing protein, partial [Polyangia bacterium]|nr:FG-GAP-like repeat-containing protein [Polyangia bacterium]